MCGTTMPPIDRKGMVKMSKITMVAVMVGLATGVAYGQISLEGTVKDHPAGDVLKRVISQSAKDPADLKSTGMTRKDYLPLIAGNIDFWKHFQNKSGGIIDPYENAEKQYSTPAFALGAALLVAEADRKDLFDPATR